MELIVFIGKKSSGKTTAAKYLVNKYGYTEKALATPLKKICKTLFCLSDMQLTDQTYKEQIDLRWGTTPRRMFQYVGTDLLRKQLDKLIPGIGEDIFVRHLDIQLSKPKYKNVKIVISDGRHQNEANYLKSKGAYIIKIVRDIPNIEIGNELSDIENEHDSEKIDQVTIFDTVIANNGSLQELYNNLDKIILS